MTTLADLKLTAESDIERLDAALEAAIESKSSINAEIKDLRAQRAEAHRILSALTPRTRKPRTKKDDTPKDE